MILEGQMTRAFQDALRVSLTVSAGWILYAGAQVLVLTLHA